MINLHWIRFVFSPTYFNGFDSVMEIITVIVSLLIAYVSYRCYKFSGEKKYKYFAWAFAAISVAFFFKIITNISIYYQVLETVRMGRIEMRFLSIKQTDLMYIIGYFLYRSLFFFGLLGIWFTLEKISSKRLILLMAWFIFVVNYFSHYAYFFFHITIFLMLLFISSSYFYHQRKVCSLSSRLVTVAFGLLAVSQLFFIFEWLKLDLYVIGTIIQTIAFIILLYTYLLVHRR